MILIINNSNNEIDNTTWNLKVLYVLKSLLKNSDAILINTTDEMNNIIKNNKKIIKGVILTGSELRICEPQKINKILDNILPLLELEVPILGICFGMQVLGIAYQSKIRSFNEVLKDYINIKIDIRCPLFENLDFSQKVFVEHNDWLSTSPIFFDTIAINGYNNIIYGIKHQTKNIYGLQFHPEFSQNGITIYKNFLKLCDLDYNKNINYSDITEVKY